MSDPQTAEIYLRHRGVDGWGGKYLNLWFDDDTWFIRCRHPSEDNFYLRHYNKRQRLECSMGEDMTQP